jgi:hypothetical protein
MACAACTRPAKEGVIVRQVLHGTDVLKDTVPDAAPIPGQPSRAQQPGQVTTTLVTDTPQAAYKRALDGVRKQLETDSARAALSRLESQIEQEQESPP